MASKLVQILNRVRNGDKSLTTKELIEQLNMIRNKEKVYMPKMSPREARRKAFLKRQQASKQVSAGFHGIFKANANVKVWKAEKGRHDIDIIPYQAGSHDPMMKPGEWTYVLEVFVHNNVGPEENKVFICPFKTYGDPCPICEHRRELIERDADEDLIKSLAVSKYPRSIYNIICHDDSRSRNEVQVFNTSHFLFEKQLIEAAQSSPRQIEDGEPPIIDFADPDDGRGIIFTREGDGRSTTFTGISFTKRKKAIPDSILEKAYILDDIIHIASYDEIYEAFWGQKREDVEDGDVEDESPRRGSSRRESPRERQSTRGKSRREEPEEEPEDEESEDDDSYLNKNEVPKKSRKKNEVAEGECPNGGVFGEDHEKLDECENCGMWEECLVEGEKMAEENEEPEKEDGKEDEEEPEPEDGSEEEEEEDEEPPSRGSRGARTTGRSSRASSRSDEEPPRRTSGRSSGSRGSRGHSGAAKGKSSTRTRRSMR